MLPIDYKSTGTLYSELITAELKRKYIEEKPAFVQRVNDLVHALEQRDAWNSLTFDTIAPLFSKLQEVLEQLWWTVEATIKLRNADDIDTIKAAGYAALKAFELNATRCDIIRDIDAALGESAVTFLEKSY